MPPANQGLGATRNERVMMHAGSVNRQAAFATERVINRPQDRRSRSYDFADKFGQVHGENIQVPSSVAEKTMKAGPMTIVDVAARENDVGDKAVAMGKDPSAANLNEGLERGCRKDGKERG